MFEQRRCQRGATRQDKVRAVLRLDAANALDDVRSKALERAPFKTFRTVGSDIFCCRIEAVRNRTARRLWPETRPDIVSATAKQQIEALAMRGGDCVPASGGPIGRGPVAVGEVVFAGDLDHAVQRDVFDDFELSHLSLRVVVSTPRSRHQVMCVVCPTHHSVALVCCSVGICCAAYRIVAWRGPTVQAAEDARVGYADVESLKRDGRRGSPPTSRGIRCET